MKTILLAEYLNNDFVAYHGYVKQDRLYAF